MRAPVVVAALTCALAVAAIAPARAEVLEPPPPAPTAVADFTAQAKLLFRVAACGGTEPVPAPVDAKIVDAHCAEMQKRFVRFRQRYVEPAQALLATVRPAGLPTRVVYPFGGGDLVSALGDQEGIVAASFDLDFLATHRAAWGFFRDRRTDLYGGLVGPRPA